MSDYKGFISKRQPEQKQLPQVDYSSFMNRFVLCFTVDLAYNSALVFKRPVAFLIQNVRIHGHWFLCVEDASKSLVKTSWRSFSIDTGSDIWGIKTGARKVWVYVDSLPGRNGESKGTLFLLLCDYTPDFSVSRHSFPKSASDRYPKQLSMVFRMTDLEETEEKRTVAEFCHLFEKSKQLFNGLRSGLYIFRQIQCFWSV